MAPQTQQPPVGMAVARQAVAKYMAQGKIASLHPPLVEQFVASLTSQQLRVWRTIHDQGPVVHHATPQTPHTRARVGQSLMPHLLAGSIPRTMQTEYEAFMLSLPQSHLAAFERLMANVLKNR